MRPSLWQLWLIPLVSGQAQQGQQSTQLLDFSASGLPICAQGCQGLQAAQGACIPPAQPASNTATYQSCFCKFPQVQSLYTSPNGVCDSACPAASDLTKVRNWFVGKCGQNKGAGNGPTTTTSTSTSSKSSHTSTSPTPTVVGNEAAQTSASSTSTASPAAGPPKSWWAGHWKWILMLIIILLAIIFFTWGGVWLKRRHKRKHDASVAAGELVDGYAGTGKKSAAKGAGPVAAMSSTNTNSNSNRTSRPVTWGPHQHQHWTHGDTDYRSYQGPVGASGPSNAPPARGSSRVSSPPPVMSGGAGPARAGPSTARGSRSVSASGRGKVNKSQPY